MDRQQWEAQQRAAKAHGKRRRTAEDPDGPWGGIEVVEDIDVDGWEQYEQAQGVPNNRDPMQVQMEILQNAMANMTHYIEGLELGQACRSHGAGHHDGGYQQPRGRSAVSDKTLKPPTLGSDSPEDDKKITNLQYTIWKKKIAVWRATVDGEVPVEVQPSLIANALRGKSAEVVWMGIDNISDITHVDGLQRIQTLLDKHYQGDVTANVTQRIDAAMTYTRGANQTLEDFITNLRLKLQSLDEVGEVLPARVRANLLIKNSRISQQERALVLATTQRSLDFNTIADVMQLLFGGTSVESDKSDRHPESGMMGYHNTRPNENSAGRWQAGKGGKGGGGSGGKGMQSQQCWNCFKPGHSSAECRSQVVCRQCGKPGHVQKDCRQGQGQGQGKGGSSGKGGQNDKAMACEAIVEQARVAVAYTTQVVRESDAWLWGILDNGCTRSVASERWLSDYEKFSGHAHEKVRGTSQRAFVFGGSSTQHKELYTVDLKVDPFGIATTFPISVIGGADTPLLVSKAQQATWHTILRMQTGRIAVMIEGRRVEFVSPESPSGLMLIPIAARQSRSVGLKVMPKKDYEVNVLMESAQPDVSAWE